MAQPGELFVMVRVPDAVREALLQVLAESGLDQALVTPEGYAVIDASGCDGGGRWPTRITLTPAGFALAKARILLLRGASRRRVFELALAGEDAREMPIRAVMHAGDVPLQVFWQP